MDPSAEAILLSVCNATQDLVNWQQEQEMLGTSMMTEAIARLLLARADMGKDAVSTTLTISPSALEGIPGQVEGVIVSNSQGGGLHSQPPPPHRAQRGKEGEGERGREGERKLSSP